MDDGLYNVHNHAFLGARLLSGIRVLKQISGIVKYHHIPHRFGLGSMYLDEEVPIESHVLHLADRTCALIDTHKSICGQIPGILKSIEERKDTIFIPEQVDALFELSKDEKFWMELSGETPLYIPHMPFFSSHSITADDLLDLSRFISHIIDFRSSFTANHSAAVARTASTLASLAGFPESECRLMLIAGYLHDLGKLAVDVTLLDKPGALTIEEFQTVKRHAFHTYRLLSMVRGFSTINAWASLHHEKLNGKGYPFGLKGKEIPLGARIMAVADVFTAVTEDRPYRKGMSQEEVLGVFESMVKDESLCPNVVNLLVDNIELMGHVLADSLQKAKEEYLLFRSAAI